MRTWLLLETVLLVQAFSSSTSLQSHCSKLRVPVSNIGHALVHVDSFDPVEAQATTVCAAHGVPNYKCESVRRELRETLQEMGHLAIREAVVNVSLDHSLAYEIFMENHTTLEQVKAPELLVVYPEEPLADTLSAYCTRYKLDGQSCEDARVGITDMVARDWGCDDPEESEVKPEREFVEMQIAVDGTQHSLKLDIASDVAVDAARFCIDRNVNLADCAALFRIVQEQTELARSNASRDSMQESTETTSRPRLRLDSPSSSRLYPQSERVYLKPNWVSKEFSDEACLFFNFAEEAVKCLNIPLEDTLFITANGLSEGYHLVYFTDKNKEEILAAKMIQVVIPTVELVEIFTATATAAGEGSDNEYLMAKIRATFFDPADRDYRVCAMLDHSFECLDPEWMAFDEREFQHGTRTELFRQSVTFHAPLDHVHLERNEHHQLSVLLVSKNNKALAMSDTVSFQAAPSVNRQTSRLHVLDPRIHTPQKPTVCPELLLSTPKLQWLCDLWRHEWGLFSQNGEDGILREIFRQIGTKTKSYVEFGTENGDECNTRYLREVDGWNGLLMDSRHEDESIELHPEFITRENLMPLLAEKYKRLVPSDLDLISIDVDFNDYWLLSAIDLTRVAPRVVVVEVNSHIPANEARTVEYDDSSDGSGGWDGYSSYFGASVAAFYRWGTRNGYSLVYCESHGVNCFLVRNDVLGENVSAVLGPEQLQNPPNFFGQGWNYPNAWQPHHKWVWL